MRWEKKESRCEMQNNYPCDDFGFEMMSDLAAEQVEEEYEKIKCVEQRETPWKLHAINEVQMMLRHF